MVQREEIKSNWETILEKAGRAAACRGNAPACRILLATKTVSAEDILYATEVTGNNLIGENRVSELSEKYDALKGRTEIHLIGSLQTNKVKNVVGKVSLIESLDSVHLAREINRLSEKAGIVSDVLVEINIGREESKGGIMPDDTDRFFEEISVFDSIRPVGIMTMAPVCEKKADYRRYFSETYNIFLDISHKYIYNIKEPVLSMGMSDSYEEAIAEGATQVRIGSALFGRRSYRT